MVDGPAAHDLEVLGLLSPGRRSVGKRSSETCSGYWDLGHTIDDERGLDAHDIVDGRYHVVTVQEVIPRHRVRRDFLGPAERQRIAGAAQMRGEQFHAFVGSAARPAPAAVVLVVGLW